MTTSLMWKIAVIVEEEENDINDAQLTDLKMNPYVLLKRCDSLEIYLKHHVKDTS